MVSVPSCSKRSSIIDHLLDWETRDATWHSFRKGEIFYTDGILRREGYNNGYDVIGIY